MNRKFERCHAVTAKWEGGWSDHPADPGGRTMYGVTEVVYHAWLKKKGRALKPVRNITKAEALAIYHDQYWLPVGGPTLAVGVDLATYDAGVNAGVSRGRRWLLASVGGPDHETVRKICKARLSFKQGLSIWKTFGKGWTNRVVDIEAKGVAWAVAAKADQPAVKQKLEDEEGKAKGLANKQTGGGAAAGGGGAAPAGVDQADQIAGWLLGGFLVAGVLVAAFLLWRAHVNRKRAEAYRREAAIQ